MNNRFRCGDKGLGHNVGYFFFKEHFLSFMCVYVCVPTWDHTYHLLAGTIGSQRATDPLELEL